MQRKVKEDRSNLINAGMNNVSYLNAPVEKRGNIYKDLCDGFKIARSVAVSPHSIS